jgi:superfamily II DNA helicase RecQ
MTIAKQNFIQLIVIDKAHTVAQDGCPFRPEFCLAVHLLRTFYDAMSIRCIQIFMSATFQECDQDVILNIHGTRLDKVIWPKLSRRSINFDVVISGLITMSVKEDYKYC